MGPYVAVDLVLDGRRACEATCRRCRKAVTAEARGRRTPGELKREALELLAAGCPRLAEPPHKYVEAVLPEGVLLEIDWRGRRQPAAAVGRQVFSAAGPVPKADAGGEAPAPDPGPSLFGPPPGQAPAAGIRHVVFVRPATPDHLGAAERAAEALREWGYAAEVERARAAEPEKPRRKAKR